VLVVLLVEIFVDQHGIDDRLAVIDQRRHQAVRSERKIARPELLEAAANIEEMALVGEPLLPTAGPCASRWYGRRD
jgi:hypothetical protein